MSNNNSRTGISCDGVKTKSPDSLNIVFVADIPTTGGATNSMVEIASVLQENYGAHCTVCTHQYSDLNKRLADKGIRSVVTGHGAFLAGGSPYKLKTAYSVGANFFRWRRAINSSICVAEREIDLSKVDIIHSNLPRTDFGELLAAKHSIPHVCHLRESSFEDFGCISLKRNPGRFLSDNSAALIAVSRFVKRNWVARGVDPNKVAVIYNGVDVSRIRRKLFNQPGRPIKIIFLGGYSRNKGLFDVLEAIAKLPRDYLANFSVDVYGYGNKIAAVRYIKKHGIAAAVNLYGPINDVANRLADYDIGLACAKAEAFGRIILEYQAAGLAVVAANRGAFSELIKDGVNGLLYDNEDASRSLSSILMRLAEHPEECNALTAERRPVRSSSDVAAEVFLLYKKVIAGEVCCWH